MATTPEGKVKKAVNDLLLKAGAYRYMPVTNGMGQPSLDFLVCHRGLFAVIETKAPGKKLTIRQEETLMRMLQARASAFVIDSEDSVDFAALKEWLEHPVSYFISGAVVAVRKLWGEE